jgi:hypothetical protein
MTILSLYLENQVLFENKILHYKKCKSNDLFICFFEEKENLSFFFCLGLSVIIYETLLRRV